MGDKTRLDGDASNGPYKSSATGASVNSVPPGFHHRQQGVNSTTVNLEEEVNVASPTNTMGFRTNEEQRVKGPSANEDTIKKIQSTKDMSTQPERHKKNNITGNNQFLSATVSSPIQNPKITEKPASSSNSSGESRNSSETVKKKGWKRAARKTEIISQDGVISQSSGKKRSPTPMEIDETPQKHIIISSGKGVVAAPKSHKVNVKFIVELSRFREPLDNSSTQTISQIL